MLKKVFYTYLIVYLFRKRNYIVKNLIITWIIFFNPLSIFFHRPGKEEAQVSLIDLSRKALVIL